MNSIVIRIFHAVTIGCLLMISNLSAIDPTYIDCANEMNSVLQSIEGSMVMVPPENKAWTIPIKITAQLVVAELNGIITEDQLLSSTTMFKLSWKDYRLAANNSGNFFGQLCSSANYSHWSYIVEAVNRLPWYPQWVVSNGGRGVLLHGAWNNYPAIVYADGRVEWVSMYLMKTECIQDVL